ncbi:hypothetical protein EfmAA96_15670 [Enterococcus faecium]|nr:hypothetical protein EfmAA96_15670 [Enterococcus faecium]
MIDVIEIKNFFKLFLKVVFHDQINVKYVDENNKSLLKDQDEIQLYGAYGENYIRTVIPFMAFVSLLIGVIQGSGIGNVFANIMAPLAGNAVGLTIMQDPTENADNKGKNEPREDQSSDDTQPIFTR